MFKTQLWSSSIPWRTSVWLLRSRCDRPPLWAFEGFEECVSNLRMTPNDPKCIWASPSGFPYISMDVLRFSTNLDAVSKCWGLRVTFHLLIFLMIWDWHRDEGIVVLTSSHCETRFIQQLIKNQNLSFFTNLWWVQSFPHIFFHLFPIRQHLHPWAQDVEVSAVFVACSSTMLPPSPGLYLQRLNVPVLLISIRIPCGLMWT